MWKPASEQSKVNEKGYQARICGKTDLVRHKSPNSPVYNRTTKIKVSNLLQDQQGWISLFFLQKYYLL